MAQATPSGEVVDQQQQLKEQTSKALGASIFLAVTAHTIQLQAEAILITRACKGDVGRAASLISKCKALTTFLGLIVNGFGGKLSDALGRKRFFVVGPLAQIFAGLLAFAKHDSLAALLLVKTLKPVCTTFSGTVMNLAALRDVFDATTDELKNEELKNKGRSFFGIILGPFLEAMILRSAGTGNERVAYLALSFLGFLGLAAGHQIPETLGDVKRQSFRVAEALQAANPLAFLRIFTRGLPGLWKLSLITALQATSDGKCLSDMSQLWMRNNLQMGVTSISNFIMLYGVLCATAVSALTGPLLRRLSARGFTTFANLCQFACLFGQGSAESVWLWVGCLPLGLPGVNGGNASSLMPLAVGQAIKCGFGRGEYTAYSANFREVMSGLASALYGEVYRFLGKRGLNQGLVFQLSAFLGCAVPQSIMMLAVKDGDLGLGPS